MEIEKIKETIKYLIDKWDGERKDNTIWRVSNGELNDMRIEDLEKLRDSI